MSTHATIAIFNEDGFITSTYVHHDGYKSYVGRMLLEHYTTKESVEELINLGDISVLAPSIEKPEGHTFENPVVGYTVAYHRDRGECYNEPDVMDPEVFVTCLEEHTYLFSNGHWKYMVNGRPVALVLDNEDMTEMGDDYFKHPIEETK